MAEQNQTEMDYTVSNELINVKNLALGYDQMRWFKRWMVIVAQKWN